MAKSSSSISTKMSLRSLFSKSELNLKESTEKDETRGRSKTQRLFRWKKKRKTTGDGTVTSRVDSPEADEEDWPDVDQKPSIYATAPRSKKGQLSNSETDLHKPKRFSTFSLGWRKKKKSVALSQSIANINAEVTHHVREPQIDDQVDQFEISQQVQHEVVEPESAPNLHTEEIMEGAGGFMPALTDGTLISYIDSDSDGYHTPPESPGLHPQAFVCAHADNDATGQAPAEPSSTYSTSDSDINIEITSAATNVTTPDFVKSVPSKIPATSSVDSNSTCLHTKVSEHEVTSAIPITESSQSTIPFTSILPMNGQHFSSAAERRDHSLTFHNLEEHEWAVDPVETILSPAEVSPQGQMESNSMSTTFSAPGSSHSSLSNSVLRPEQTDIQMKDIVTTLQIDSSSKTRHNNIDTALPNTPDHMILTTECAPSSKQENADHNGWVSPSLGEVSGDSLTKSGSTFKPLYSPVLPEIILLSTELSSFSHDQRDLEEVSVSVDASLTSTDVTDSLQPIPGAVEPVCHGPKFKDESVSSSFGIETLLGPSNTVGIDPKDDSSNLSSRCTYSNSSRQGTNLVVQATPEPEVCSLETLNKVSTNNKSISTSHLTIHSDSSYYTPISGTQLEHENMDAQINLGACESQEPQILFQEHGGNELVTHGNDFDEHEIQLNSEWERKVEEHATNQEDLVECKAEVRLAAFYTSETRMNDQKTEAHHFAKAQDLSEDVSVSSSLGIETLLGPSNTVGIDPKDDTSNKSSGCTYSNSSRQGTDLVEQATPEPEVCSLETLNKVSTNNKSISTSHLTIHSDSSYYTPISGTQLEHENMDAQINLGACESQEPQILFQEHGGNELVTHGNDFDEHEIQLNSEWERKVEEHATNQEDLVECKAEVRLAAFYTSETRMNDQKTEAHHFAKAQDLSEDVSVSSSLGIETLLGPSNTVGIDPKDDTSNKSSGCTYSNSSRQGTDLVEQATPEPEVCSLETLNKVSTNNKSISTSHLTIHSDIPYHTPISGTQLEHENMDAQINLEACESQEPQILFQEHGGNELVTHGNDFDEHEIQLNSEWERKVEEHATNQEDLVECKAEVRLAAFYTPETRMNDQKTEAHHLAKAQDLSGRESEVLAAEVAWQLSDLAITKPDMPVQREQLSEECTVAPPWSLHGEVSITDCNLATCSHLGAGYSPSLTMLSGSVITLQEDTAGGGASLHTEREQSSIQEQATLTEASRTSRVDTYTHLNVSTGEEEPSETLHSQASLYRRHTVKNSANAEEIATPETEDRQDINNKATVTSSAARRSALSADTQNQHNTGDPSLHSVNSTTSRTFTEKSAGIIVIIRGLENEKGDHSTRTSTLTDQPPASSYTSVGRFSHALPALSTVAEESDPESPASGSDTDMSSGIGVLSTTLTLKPKGSEEGSEDGKRVHKVSLVNNSSSSTNRSVYYQDRLTDLNSASHGLGSIWSTQHENSGTTEEESKPSTIDTSYSNLSGNTHLYSSLSTSSYEPTSYSSYSSSFSSDTPPSSVSMDTTGSLGNSNWWNLRSEVQESSESRASGRRWEELSVPAETREVEREGGTTNTGSLTQQSDDFFTGVFKATRVELPSSPTDNDPEPAPEPSMPASPHEMETLLDTLKSMGPPVRHRSLRSSSTQPFSSLPPIVEDAPSPFPAPISSPTSPGPKETFSSLPPDLGLSWNSMKDMRSPLTMMKEQQGSELPTRSLVLPSRASAISSIVMRKSSLPDLNLEDGTQVNGSGLFGTSRLDHSLIFSSSRSETEENGKAFGHRSLFRTASLPEVSSGLDRLSVPPKAADAIGSGISRLERLSFLTSPTGSLTGLNETSRISVSPSFPSSSTLESPTLNHTPPHSLELYRSLSPESPIKRPTPPSLQRSLSAEGLSSGSPHFNDVLRGFGVAQEPGPERTFVAKYRAFPDAYLTKEKEHGKLNPRPGKMIIYDQPGLCGRRTEVRGDIMDATAWQFPATISIRVVRGGWVLYEKPDFKGEKIALDEGDIELTDPFGPAEDEQNHMQNGTQELGEDHELPKPERRFIIGSLRRAVRDYSVPEICLFPEENAEGKKVVFRDTSEDSRIFGFPIKANSIIINAGLWLVFAEPFFQGVPRVLEVGGFPNPAAWGVTQPYVSSLHPLKIGEPRVEKPNEPKLVIYDKPYFTGKSREIYTNTRDFMTREDRQQTAFMYSAGSIKVFGGIWVGYEKEGFRGHQYLLEEGEYHDWRVWGGCDTELRSVRVIRTDLSQPMLVMFEMPNEEEEMQEDRTFEVTEAVPDVELFGFRPATRSIHVLSGAWVAYSHVDYSGNQYVLEKGFYNNCADWGSEDNRICSIQPILQAQTEGPSFRSELLLYSEPAFQGLCHVYTRSHEALPEKLTVQSCRVVGGSWVLYNSTNFLGDQYVLSEGDYANFSSMGCPPNCLIRSVKSVPMMFSVPSISLFGLECFEGREVTLENEVSNMLDEGYNPHILSVRVNSGCWVLCEHTNYRGHQFLLEPMEITNWHKFSSLSSIGSMYPIRAKRRLFRIRYKETGDYMSVQGGVNDMKSGRVVVSKQVEGMSDIWFYQDGLIKNKLAQNMSLQVMGNVESGAKVVLWSETRTPVQTWSAQLSGTISSLTFPGLLLDVKGGKTYDKEHVIIRSDTEENSSLWELELL